MQAAPVAGEAVAAPKVKARIPGYSMVLSLGVLGVPSVVTCGTFGCCEYSLTRLAPMHLQPDLAAISVAELRKP